MKKVNNTIKEGYRWIRINNSLIQEHRYKMEQKLGRKLISSEIVHHINHNKLDNRIENLLLTTRSEHKKIHDKIGVSTRSQLETSILFESRSEDYRL